MPPPSRLLLGVSGSAAILNLPAYVAAFRQCGVQQIVALMTTSATHLLSVETMSLICDKAYTDETAAGQHVRLARWAEMFLVLPTTAHTLACSASGLSPNLLTTTIAATESSVVFAPAMNVAMWNRPPVKRNVCTLRGDGHRVIEPELGIAWEVAGRAFVETLVLPTPEHLCHALGFTESSVE